MRVGQHRDDRHPVRESRHRADVAEAAVGRAAPAAARRRDVEEVAAAPGTSRGPRRRTAGCGRRCRPRSACARPPVSRQISQESTVPTQTSASGRPAGSRRAASAILGAREHRVDPQPGPAADQVVRRPGWPIASTTSAVRTSCQPITGPSGSPGARSPRRPPTRAGWTGQPRPGRGVGAAASRQPPMAGSTLDQISLGVLLDPARARGDGRPTGAEPVRPDGAGVVDQHGLGVGGALVDRPRSWRSSTSTFIRRTGL